MLPFLAGMFTKAAVGNAILGTVGAAAVGAIQRKQAKKDLAEQRAYDEGAMQRMRDAASNAGFNPLTALRAGALSSFNTPGRVLPPGGAAFAAQYLGDAIGEAFDKKANEPIDKYNAEIRKLELEQRKLDLSISRATLGQLSAPKTQLNIPPAGQKIGSSIQTTVLPSTGASIAQEALDMLGVRQDAQGKYVSDRGEAIVKTYTGSSGRVYRLPSSGLEWDDLLISSLLAVNDAGWQVWDYAKENAPKLSRKVMQYVQ